MTTDLWMLVASVGLSWALILIAAIPSLLRNGPGWSMGNRDDTREPTVFNARAKRASANMLENLPLFAALVLVAHGSGQAGETSALGAQVFFYSRVAHAFCYLVGIPVLRTGAWAVSVGGMFIVAWSLLG